VDQPTVEDTISILRGLKERFEVHHGVRIQDSALVTATMLSDRYISDRFLPDKAIDLVDEACATIRTEMDSMPTELDEVTRRVMQLEIEEAALKKEKDAASRERLEALRKELAEHRSKGDGLRAQWEAEKDAIHKLQSLREEIERLRHQIDVAERNYDLNRAAELKHGRLPELERQLETDEKALADKQGFGSLLREEVTDDEIAEIVSRWTHIPVTRLMEGEREKLLKLEEHLHKRVVGQNEAVQAVAEAVLRSRAGIKDPNRPIGSFIFLGPTGVGKTELARALAENLFDDEANMIRIDMSEYMERHTVARLIGAPPGYVGYEEGGQLTEAVRRKPYSVILFDEIEKAHQDVFNILLQIMDDGRLTDSQGRTVDFKNCIVIMTSNIGSQHILDNTGTGESSYEDMRQQVLHALRQHFRPEFLNRVDETLVFHSLTEEELAGIVEIQVSWLQKRLEDRRISLEFTDEVKELLAKRGYDPTYGARPLKRTIQKMVETPMAKMIMAGEVPDGSRVLLGADETGVVFEVVTGRENGEEGK
jgi:ATP-dependent Clp protease ATP-binding subunit ClpB